MSAEGENEPVGDAPVGAEPAAESVPGVEGEVKEDAAGDDPTLSDDAAVAAASEAGDDDDGGEGDQPGKEKDDDGDEVVGVDEGEGDDSKEEEEEEEEEGDAKKSTQKRARDEDEDQEGSNADEGRGSPQPGGVPPAKRIRQEVEEKADAVGNGSAAEDPTGSKEEGGEVPASWGSESSLVSGSGDEGEDGNNEGGDANGNSTAAPASDGAMDIDTPSGAPDQQELAKKTEDTEGMDDSVTEDVPDVKTVHADFVRPGARETDEPGGGVLDLNTGQITSKPPPPADSKPGDAPAEQPDETKKATGASESADANSLQNIPIVQQILPPSAKWFDIDKISRLEVRMLPEFFTGRSASKTPEFYLQSRNFIVQLYARLATEDPAAFVSGTDCRRKLAGDSCAILRIHEFLERFGIINNSSLRSVPEGTVTEQARVRQRKLFAGPPPPMELWELSRPGGISSGGEGRAEEGEDGDVDSITQLKDWSKERKDELIRAAVAHAGDWEKVADALGGGIDAAQCLQRFMMLSVENILEYEEQVWEGEVSGKEEKVAAEPNKLATPADTSVRQVRNILSPFYAEASPALALAHSFLRSCDGRVLKAAMGAASEEVQRINEEAVSVQPDSYESDEDEERAPKPLLRDMDLLKAASASAMSIVSLQAQALAESESRCLQEMLGDLQEARLRRLEGRIKRLDALEDLLDRETRQLECDRAEMLMQQARAWLP
jgi:hypothetical protein